MASRKLNGLETKIHQAALRVARPLTQKEVDNLATDAKARTEAMNFLLGAGMLKVMVDSNHGLTYSALRKEEIELKKGMNGDEIMVLNHIQAAKDQGIWTKHLKAKTGLHQTVLDRCLKQLSQKQIVKTVKGVANHPTRKIYMMANLDPSVELTGGPWYTDGELDAEFIKLISSACLRFIRTRSFPKDGRKADTSVSLRPLYAISNSPAYPTLQQLLQFLQHSNITETQLTEEHVETLLNTLILDGEVEKLPAFGSSMWAATEMDEASDETSDSEVGTAPKTKKRRLEKVGHQKDKEYRDEDAYSSSDELVTHEKDKKGKMKDINGKRKKREESSDESDNERTLKRRKRRRISARTEGETDEDAKPLRNSSGILSKSSSSSDTDEVSPQRSRVHARSRSRSRSLWKMAPDTLSESSLGGAHVYRAIHQERVTMGWSQAPCAPCPTFSFCRDGGPVGPKECVYYNEWSGKQVAAPEY